MSLSLKYDFEEDPIEEDEDDKKSAEVEERYVSLTTWGEEPNEI